MSYRWLCHSPDELPSVSAEILEKAGSKIAFFGELGSGKTTIIKYICQHLGVKEIVNSPTFPILNEYSGKGCRILHFDFYRITKIEEIYDLGYEEYLFSDNYIFIEWPDRLEFLLPDFFSIIKIEVGKNKERIIQLTSEKLKVKS